MSSDNSKTGVVLSGGGARGAYQAGVLHGLATIAKKHHNNNPFPVITGTSAGALNATYIAAHADKMLTATLHLRRLWEQVRTDHIFKSDPLSLGKISMRWLLELTTGGFFAKRKTRALLDTSPLLTYIKNSVNFKNIQKLIDSGHLHAVALSAINYNTGFNRTFYQGDVNIQPWERTRRKGERMRITPEHVMASASIPLLFPPIKVGEHYYGDGSLRNFAPLSPAIKMGADKLIVIGVRQKQVGIIEEEMSKPSLGRIISVILNSVLMDAIDTDYERLARINDTLEKVGDAPGLKLKPVETIIIRPNADIGEIASEESGKMPLTLRHLIKGLGSEDEASDLISYLLFEPSFTKRLIEMGYDDAMRREDELVPFLKG